MVDPKKVGSDYRISLSDGMGYRSPLKAITDRALEQGYTDLRFNPKTMGWAYHKPDQAVGEDGRFYVKADLP